MQPSTVDMMEPIQRLDKDLKSAARLLGRQQARYLVDAYYTAQDNRIRADTQTMMASKSGEPNRLLDWTANTHRVFESDIKRALGVFSDQFTVGRWMQSICGIGPVISAGLLAHLDIRRAPTYGHFWSFAGVSAVQKWEKGQKRPWNAELKCLLCYKLGECFVKVQNKDSDFYGKMLINRKKFELERNEARAFAPQAAQILESKRIGKDTDAHKYYKDGRLPPAHIHARARRWAIKLFLSHLHHVMFEDYNGKTPPAPYIIEHPEADTKDGQFHDHRHFIPPPLWPMAEEDKGRGLQTMAE